MTDDANFSPAPSEGSPYEVYRDHCRQGTLAYQVTPDGSAVFHPRVLAPGTGVTDLRWRAASGRGTVYATTTVHPRHGEPYNVAVIELAEGFTMMSRVDGVEPSAVTVGMHVEMRMTPLGDDGEPWPVFVPAAGPAEGER